jgi:pyrimidine operon attenuation protein / uracil phosphoribosyltransferase
MFSSITLELGSIERIRGSGAFWLKQVSDNEGYYFAVYFAVCLAVSALPMPPKVVEILSAEEIRRTLNRLASQIVERSGDISALVLLGIFTRGVPLANLLARQIEALEQVKVAVGALDITFYRDDLDQINLRTPEKTDIPLNLSGKTVILVDDVIFKGRTIRAALNAVNEYGRPEVIRLAVLIDRGHREVPIHPDFTGKKLPTSKEEKIKVYLQDLDGRDAVELIRPTTAA